jgi:outer membrane protein, heavy metal efflux system
MRILPDQRAPFRSLVGVLFALTPLFGFAADSRADDGIAPLPSPLSLQSAIQHAAAARAEVRAAQAALEAAYQRPAIASALDDPMLMVGIDHYPYRRSDAPMSGGKDENPAMAGGARYDWSFQVEQQFPLSRLRLHRRRAAEAGIEVERAALAAIRAEVVRETSEGFFMLHEADAMVLLGQAQLALAEDVVDVGLSRLATALGSQADLLRAEAERARLAAELEAATARVNAARAMLNAALGRPVTAPLPPLQPPELASPPPPVEAALRRAGASRPELARMRAEVSRADAEVEVMRAMGAPMGFVRLGEARTMAEGRGAMAMVGVSLPLWRGRVRAGVAEARAMRAMAEAEVEAMQRMVDAEAVAAREAVAAARARTLAYREDVVPRAQRAVDSTLAAYAAGNGSLLAVLEAMQAQWRAEEAHLMASTELGRAWAQLQRATGEDISP